MTRVRRRRVVGVLIGLLLLLALLLAAGIRVRYGADPGRYPDLTSAQEGERAQMEVVATLDMPPCNIAVSPQGRVFFTFHPEARPDVNVVEWVGGKAQPFPDAAFNDAGSPLHFQSVYALRIDRFNRLWALDHGHHGFGQPRLLAFDLATRALVRRFDLPRDVAPPGSQMNDFQVDPDGRFVYIADTSIFGKKPAIVVVDLEHERARRVLQQHASVTADGRALHVDGQPVVVWGLFTVRPDVDSIALDTQGQWLYYAPMAGEWLYRIPARELRDFGRDDAAMAAAVERHARKPASDGISVGRDGSIYIANPEQSALNVVRPDRTLHTLFKDPLLAWPDGLGFGPDGWLYISASGLHKVMMRPRGAVVANGPYRIVRVRVTEGGVPGH